MAVADVGWASGVRGEVFGLISSASEALARVGVDNARLDAELMLAHALGVEREGLFSRRGGVAPVQMKRFRALLERRLRREPLAYILERKEFFSLDFEVGSAVLIPRPETELLVEETARLIAAKTTPRVLDLGTGSGAIAIAVASRAKRARVVGVDVSLAALEFARRNAARHLCCGRVEFVSSDLWEGLRTHGRRLCFDVVVSNPPYVTEAEMQKLAPEVREYEPRAALAGGLDGLDIVRRIVAGVRDFLTAGGALILEVGADQAGAVAGLMRDCGMGRVAVRRDLGGAERAVVGFAPDGAVMARERSGLTARLQ